MAKIFISFVHEEQEAAMGVKEFLESFMPKGKKPSIFVSADKSQVYAGEDWLGRIRTELRQSVVVVLLLSKRSIKRPWVNFESGAAWMDGKRIIPVCVGGLMKNKLPNPYSGMQALTINKEFLCDEAYYLVTSVFHYLDLSVPFEIPPPPIDTRYAKLWSKVGPLMSARKK